MVPVVMTYAFMGRAPVRDTRKYRTDAA
jgi:hypothetical protein